MAQRWQQGTKFYKYLSISTTCNRCQKESMEKTNKQTKQQQQKYRVDASINPDRQNTDLKLCLPFYKQASSSYGYQTFFLFWLYI